MDAIKAEIAQKYVTFHQLFSLSIELKIDLP